MIFNYGIFDDICEERTAIQLGRHQTQLLTGQQNPHPGDLHKHGWLSLEGCPAGAPVLACQHD